MMALSHHIVVRYAGFRIGIRKPKYWILGDDALLVGDDLYNSYREVCDQLHMKVNVSKTFRSVRLFEFAKRFFYNRMEISAFPLGAVLTSDCDISRIAVALDNAKAKSWFGGSEWFRLGNRRSLRVASLGFLKVLWDHPSRPLDLSLIDRIERMICTFSLLRMAYRDSLDLDELQAILPSPPKCTVSKSALSARLRYIFQLSIKEKAESVLSQAHVPVFMKRSEFMMKLMMSGKPPPCMLPGQATP